MKNLSNKEKILLIILIVLATVFLYYKFLILPIRDEYVSTATNVKNLQKQLSGLKQTEASNAKLAKDLAEMKGKYDEAAKSLPKYERVPDIARSLKPIFDNNKVNFTNITFGQAANYDASKNGTANAAANSNASGSSSAPAQAGSANKNDLTLMSVPVNISISGDYDNIMACINAIENYERITEIDTIGLSGSDKGDIQASLSMRYYFISNTKNDELKYDFNTGNYGKNNLFK